MPAEPENILLAHCKLNQRNFIPCRTGITGDVAFLLLISRERKLANEDQREPGANSAKGANITIYN